jgi:hypothetical protein
MSLYFVRKEVLYMNHDTLCQVETTNELASAPTQEQIIDTMSHSVRIIEPPPTVHLGRPPEVSTLHVCLAVVATLLHGTISQLDVWRTICSQCIGDFGPRKVSDQTIYNHLETCAQAMRELFFQVSVGLRTVPSDGQEHRLAPFATRVLSLDESTLDQMKRWLRGFRSLQKGSKALLAGRISALFDVRLQQWVQVDLLDEAVNDSREHAEQMIQQLEAGCLLLFDKGYSKFLWFDELTRRKIFWVSRVPVRVTYVAQHTLYQGDGIWDAIVFLGQYRADQTDYPVRLVQFWWQGKFHRYLTNVLDPQILPLHELAALYARRWDIEMAFRLLKDYLKGAEIWSAKWPVIEGQLWGLFLLAQILHAWQGTIARKAGVDRFDVSMELALRYLPRLMQQGKDPTEAIVHQGWDIGIFRPSTRGDVHGLVIDPCWITPAPPEASQPRAKPARHAPEQPKPHKYRKTGSCSSVYVPPHRQ